MWANRLGRIEGRQVLPSSDTDCSDHPELEHAGEDEPRLGGSAAGRTIGRPDKNSAEVEEPDGPPENDPVRTGLVNDGFAFVEFHCLSYCR